MTHRKHKKPNKHEMATTVLDENELRNFLEDKASKGNLILFLSMTKKHVDFSKELEEVYFTPGTIDNEDFTLIMLPPHFFIIVPDTPKNRSAISVLSHKHGLRLPKLTKFDEYMELAYQVKNRKENEEFMRKMFNDVFKFIDERYRLKNVKSISKLYLNEERWRNLDKKLWRLKLTDIVTTEEVEEESEAEPKTLESFETVFPRSKKTMMRRWVYRRAG